MQKFKEFHEQKLCESLSGNFSLYSKKLLSFGITGSLALLLANSLFCSEVSLDTVTPELAKQKVELIKKEIPVQEIYNVVNELEKVNVNKDYVKDPELRKSILFHEVIGGKLSSVCKKYNDSKGIPTIGIGFNLNRNDAKSLLQAIGSNYNDIMSGSALNEKQMNALFDITLNESVESAKALFGDLNAYPDQVSRSLIELIFNMGRNKIAHSFPKFVQKIIAKNYIGAGLEMYYKNGKDGETTNWWKQVTNNHGDYDEVKAKNPENRAIQILDSFVIK